MIKNIKFQGFPVDNIYCDEKVELYKKLGLIEAKNLTEIKGKEEKSKTS